MVYVIHTGLLRACEQDQDGTSWSCLQAVSKPLWRIPFLCVLWKTPDDGQWNCPKHAEFYSKNKFEILVHLVGFIIRTYHWKYFIDLLLILHQSSLRELIQVNRLKKIGTNNCTFQWSLLLQKVSFRFKHLYYGDIPINQFTRKGKIVFIFCVVRKSRILF